ncbi:EAL domain-containing protein [Vibrio sp. SCSIO 43140]|uniref:EAL domain-containing protein n=1 Tax=Vibrio sp. SCSIO 43140 TaxID=2819100 RepID=UPI0020764F6A|nr:EAL domain-containing protein [Vibrio sp. SCSIO 43140]USD63028.1 EAL domain-containing protein [Vibrio sp. SCSIO 43140]
MINGGHNVLARHDRKPAIGVILPMLSGFYMGEITSTLRAYGADKGVNLIFYRVGHKRDFDLPFALDHVDGLIIVLHAAANSLVEQAVAKGIPVVSIAASYAPLAVESFSSDQKSGVCALYDHLTSLGHSNIGFCGDLSVNDVRMRFKAFQARAESHGRVIGRTQILNVSSNALQGGREAYERYWNHGSPCTAIICATDHIAVGLMERLGENGISVPKQVAVVGIDNIFMGERTEPKLTTVDQQLERLSIAAAERLMARIAGAPYSSGVCSIEQLMVVRDSCGSDSSSTNPEFGIRKQLLSHTERSPAELHETLYSQGQSGFSSIVNASCLFDTSVAWAVCGVKANSESCITAHSHTNGRQLYHSDQGIHFPTEAFPQSSLYTFPEAFVMTLLCVTDRHDRHTEVMAVVEPIEETPDLAKISSYNNYLDMLALFLERDLLLHSSQSRAQVSTDLANQLQVVSHSSNDVIWDWDLISDELVWSSRWNDILKLSDGDSTTLTSQCFFDLVHPDDLSKLENQLLAHLDIETPFKSQFRLRRTDGVYVWLSSTGRVIKDKFGRPVRFLGAMTDITEQKRSADKIRQLAYHDPLTGLANRRMMTERLKAHIRDKNEQPLALMLMDLNRFKFVNDTYGHDVGDALLLHVSKQLNQVVRKNDLIARFGGDEFLLMCDVETSGQALELASRILRAVEKPFCVGDNEFNTQGSLGIAFYPFDAVSAEELVKKADIAMYRAKRSKSRKAALYDTQLERESQQLLSVEQKLRRVLANDKLEVWYQSIHDQESGAVTGLEALARWQDEDGEYVSPQLFIGVAEESGLIVKLSEIVLTKVCEDLADKRIDSAFSVSINISSSLLSRPHFAIEFVQKIFSYDLSPAQFTVEITESIALNDFEQCLRALNALKAAGVRISLDDFGTGYSSLSMLKQLPLDEVKIDRSFIRDLGSDLAHNALVESVITMAHAFGYDVVAEGVECEKQYARLKEMNCDMYQGYWFAKPQPLSVVKTKRLSHAV